MYTLALTELDDARALNVLLLLHGLYKIDTFLFLNAKLMKLNATTNSHKVDFDLLSIQCHVNTKHWADLFALNDVVQVREHFRNQSVYTVTANGLH